MSTGLLPGPPPIPPLQEPAVFSGCSSVMDQPPRKVRRVPVLSAFVRNIGGHVAANFIKMVLF